jgi:hypothetical protein
VRFTVDVNRYRLRGFRPSCRVNDREGLATDSREFSRFEDGDARTRSSETIFVGG